jgi:hypothetical protein
VGCALGSGAVRARRFWYSGISDGAGRS